jgi:3-isopropylmalate/(R)-2-methylmalate dehydratase small subunit
MRGRCWLFGNDVGCDGDMMPFRFALARETRPEVLRDFAMTGLDPDFPKKAKPGDIVIAGKRFGQGNPHIQAFIGLKALGLGVVVESIPRGSLRNAVNAGLPILPECAGIAGAVRDGDQIEVDFASGATRNLSAGTEYRFAPLPPALLDIVRRGGWEANFRARLAARSAVPNGDSSAT